MAFSVFEYLYRDASNYKSYGKLWLLGSVTDSQCKILRLCFQFDDLFVAEQVGIEPLYQELFQYSGGATIDDHSWHTFLDIREEKVLPKDSQTIGNIGEFVERFVAVDGCWDPELSPNYFE